MNRRADERETPAALSCGSCTPGCTPSATAVERALVGVPGGGEYGEVGNAVDALRSVADSGCSCNVPRSKDMNEESERNAKT